MPDTVSPTALDTRFRQDRELAETALRGVLGGVFYVLGWLAVAWQSQLLRQRPAIALGLLLLFVVLAVIRVVLARRRAGSAADVTGLLALWWSLFVLTAATWSGISVWVLLDPALAGARMAMIVCSIAYATAFAHTFAMNWRGALLSMALLCLPSAVLSWRLPDLTGVAFALTVYLVYLLSALRTSRNQYERQLALELALRHQRDLYEQQSRTDALTGLDNRREFTFNLERSFVQEESLWLLMIDIDHFKQINDRYGHAAGDAVLIAFAEQLRDHFDQPAARLARIGGEEFAVLLQGLSEDAASTAAQTLCERIARAPLAPDAARGAVTVSIGVGRRLLQGSPDEFFAEVDRALYRAKQRGRNCVCAVD